MDALASLKHEVALLGEEEVLAPKREAHCSKSKDHPEARRIDEASRRGLLRCHALLAVTIPLQFNGQGLSPTSYPAMASGSSARMSRFT